MGLRAEFSVRACSANVFEAPETKWIVLLANLNMQKSTDKSSIADVLDDVPALVERQQGLHSDDAGLGAAEPEALDAELHATGRATDGHPVAMDAVAVDELRAVHADLAHGDPEVALPSGSTGVEQLSPLTSELERSPFVVTLSGDGLEASPGSPLVLPRFSDSDLHVPPVDTGIPADISVSRQTFTDASEAMHAPTYVSIGAQEPAPAVAAFTDTSSQCLSGGDELLSLISHLKFGQTVQQINEISAATASRLASAPGVELQNFGQSLRDNAFKYELPRLIIIGDEKSGKSSTVERLAMAPVFPRQDEATMTRQPILLKLRFSEDHPFDRPLYILTIPPCENSRGNVYDVPFLHFTFVTLCACTTRAVCVISLSPRVPTRSSRA